MHFLYCYLLFLFSSGSLYIPGVFNLEMAFDRMLLLPLYEQTLYSSLITPLINKLAWVFSCHMRNLVPKVYDHNIVYIVLLLSINETLKLTGKLQKLPSLLQSIIAEYQKKNLRYKLLVSNHQDQTLLE